MKIYDKKQGKLTLYVRSMGKVIEVTAIFSDDANANAHMAKPNNNDGVVACWGPLVILADMYDKGIEIRKAA